MWVALKFRIGVVEHSRVAEQRVRKSVKFDSEKSGFVRTGTRHRHAKGERFRSLPELVIGFEYSSINS
ncbi:hypothetical protein RchiOBHm_Chr5g0021581 [Rosa chinensis]|uniref:Uncharacterized protein n=1 Tax=Rosa chinensis TaxID=74649 RepID=A0A2P6Q7J7_ROSCH|nr:hypothetical protein RchiOBHm_Chr5g0021581 [Rosa chinensis]